MEYFCTPSNCSVGPECGNSIHTKPGLVLRRGKNGCCVVTSIRAGQCIAPYWGRLTTFDYEAMVEVVSDYVMALIERSTRGKKVSVDAKEAGGISRFMNHSCEPNARFVERRYRRDVVVMVIAQQDIQPGDEISVSYGEEVWFPCSCGAVSCVNS